MSALFGMYRLDGRPVCRVELELMSSILAHRGSDAAGVWSEHGVGLGHRILWTTPESLQERLPLANDRGEIVITADARIDNREELIRDLDLSHHPAVEISDGALILAAYQKWGERCPERFFGDFAFVVWDKRQQTLFAARDHFGVKPLYYYYQPRRLFACASEIKALLVLPEVARRLNEVQVADYLAGLYADKASTFYRDIMRLPPAHRLAVNVHAMHMHAYWTLDGSSEIHYPSDADYAAAYKELFTEAVRCRLRSAFPVGSHLSGGLDSSSVTCVARKLLEETKSSQLHTFSNVFDKVPECDERPFIKAVLTRNDVIAHDVHADRSSPLADLEAVFAHQDEPSIGANHFLPWQLNQAAAAAGVRIVLDGFDGDTTVSHGAARFAELAQAGEWATFAREAKAVSSHFPVTPLGLLRTYGLRALENSARRQRWFAFARAIAEINSLFQISRRQLIWQHGFRALAPSWVKQRKKGPAPSIHPIINADFAHEMGLEGRILTLAQCDPPRSAREDQWRTLTSSLFTYVLELSDRCAAAFGIETRHPFMDRRLITFCLAVPADQKLYDGWSRIVMRRAMADILPDEVRWRGGKTDMNPNFLRGFLRSDREILEKLALNPAKCVQRYINTNIFRQICERVTKQESIDLEEVMILWRATTLACWLERSS